MASLPPPPPIPAYPSTLDVEGIRATLLQAKHQQQQQQQQQHHPAILTHNHNAGNLLPTTSLSLTPSTKKKQQSALVLTLSKKFKTMKHLLNHNNNHSNKDITIKGKIEEQHLQEGENDEEEEDDDDCDKENTTITHNTHTDNATTTSTTTTTIKPKRSHRQPSTSAQLQQLQQQHLQQLSLLQHTNTQLTQQLTQAETEAGLRLEQALEKAQRRYDVVIQEKEEEITELRNLMDAMQHKIQELEKQVETWKQTSQENEQKLVQTQAQAQSHTARVVTQAATIPPSSAPAAVTAMSSPTQTPTRSPVVTIQSPLALSSFPLSSLTTLTPCYPLTEQPVAIPSLAAALPSPLTKAQALLSIPAYPTLTPSSSPLLSPSRVKLNTSLDDSFITFNTQHIDSQPQLQQQQAPSLTGSKSRRLILSPQVQKIADKVSALREYDLSPSKPTSLSPSKQTNTTTTAAAAASTTGTGSTTPISKKIISIGVSSHNNPSATTTTTTTTTSSTNSVDDIQSAWKAYMEKKGVQRERELQSIPITSPSTPESKRRRLCADSATKSSHATTINTNTNNNTLSQQHHHHHHQRSKTTVAGKLNFEERKEEEPVMSSSSSVSSCIIELKPAVSHSQIIIPRASLPPPAPTTIITDPNHYDDDAITATPTDPDSDSAMTITASDARKLQSELRRCRSLLDLKQEWNIRVKTMNTIEDVSREAGIGRWCEWSRELEQLRPCLIEQLQDLRSTIVRETCRCLIALCECNCNAFEREIEMYWTQLCKGLYVTIKVIRDSCDECMMAMIERIPGSMKLLSLVCHALNDNHATVREKSGLYLTAWMKCYMNSRNRTSSSSSSSSSATENAEIDTAVQDQLCTVLVKYIHDSDNNTRAAFRSLYKEFAKYFPTKATALYNEFSGVVQRTLDNDRKSSTNKGGGSSSSTSSSHKSSTMKAKK